MTACVTPNTVGKDSPGLEYVYECGTATARDYLDVAGQMPVSRYTTRLLHPHHRDRFPGPDSGDYGPKTSQDRECATAFRGFKTYGRE